MQRSSSAPVRFGAFQLDLRTAELRRDQTSIKLQPQPAKILVLLVSRAGELVTREELAEQVWGAETFVDFEQGLNFAIRQIRAALEDERGHPQFVETVPKKGYRFIAPVENGFEKSQEVSAPEAPIDRAYESRSGATQRPKWSGWQLLIASVALFVIFLVGFFERQRVFQTNQSQSVQSLAVLPFRNLSGDPEQEYFSDGMTDQLITDLAKAGRLKVISHTSVETYKTAKSPLPQIARELGVDAIIEGTVIRSGDRIRITAQLIDARSDRHLWAESYERPVEDVIALQSQVAQQIVMHVGISLTATDRERLAKMSTIDPAANEAYLKGKYYWNQLSCSGYTKALDYFQQAVSKDPHYASAYFGLADTYFNLADMRCWPQDDAFAKSKAAALKAVELDPESADAHAELGELAFYREWDWRTTEKEFNRALDLDPNNAGAHASYSIYLVSMGRQEEGLAEIRKAHELDPISQITNMMFTYVFYLAHQYDQCIDQANKALELHPDSTGTYHWLAQCYEQKGMPQEAIAAYLRATSGLTDEVPRLRAGYDKGGLPGYWEEFRQWMKRNRPLDPVQEALICSRAGEKERALTLLGLAHRQHSDGLQFLNVEPAYDGIRDDPRFKKLVARLNL